METLEHYELRLWLRENSILLKRHTKIPKHHPSDVCDFIIRKSEEYELPRRMTLTSLAYYFRFRETGPKGNIVGYGKDIHKILTTRGFHYKQIRDREVTKYIWANLKVIKKITAHEIDPESLVEVALACDLAPASLPYYYRKMKNKRGSET